MSNYPQNLDDDISIIRVDDAITELGGQAIDQCRDAIFAIEDALGTNIAGTANSLAARLGISLDPAGNLLPSAIAAAGLVSLPITNSQISPTAGILESKLTLDHRTADLFNMISNFSLDLGTVLSFVADTGIKIEPHIDGTGYFHDLSAIMVNTPFLLNKYGLPRNNTNAYTLLSDINTDLNTHEKDDGTIFGTIPPINYAHVASGINLNVSTFNYIPQTTTDVQLLADFLDSSGILLLGTRIQTLYANGIPRTARATSFNDATHGQLIVPPTTATTFLLDGGSSTPVDNITDGDDVVRFTPLSDDGYVFDSQFAQIRIGDILTVNYGSVVLPFIIRETKYISSGGIGTFLVRIDGKNLLATTTAIASVNRPLFNTDKTGVLALAPAWNPSANLYPSLILGSARGAQVIGTDFVPDQVDSKHYNLYLQLYPTGNPNDGVISLPAIDITGEKGISPGLYTLDTIVQNINNAFRIQGYNYRFIAYNYFGQFGLMLADHYNNVSFSIIAGAVTSSGNYDPSGSATLFPNNVIDVFTPKDALGLGLNGSGVASPPFSASYAIPTASQLPTFIWPPLKRKNFYVNGVERDSFNLEPNQLIDGYGDGYWPATITNQTIVPGINVFKTYKVLFNLSNSSLQIGNTIVVQQETGQGGSIVDFGRFIITDVEFNNCNCDGYTGYTTITVFDAIHSTGISPFVSAPNGTIVRLYYNAGSVGFNKENLSDNTSVTGFARHMEVYVDQNGNSFTQERGRANITGSNIAINSTTLYSDSAIKFVNLYKISPKLRGYTFGSVRKINLVITSYNSITGIFTGNLRRWDGSTASNAGPTTVGKLGIPVRFYDETNIDFIDFIFEPKDNVPTFAGQNIDVQLFPTLSLDDEVLLVGTCQVNDLNKRIRYIIDQRQFGNTSEKDLSTSALDYIATPTKLLSENGVIRGFDVVSIANNNVFVNGGTAIVNGKVIQLDNSVAAIPAVYEAVYLEVGGGSTTVPNITWFLCVSDSGELVTIASTDFDPNGAFAASYSPLDNTRMFWAIEPVSSNTYQLRGTYFSDLVLNQKDLVPIAVLDGYTSVSGGVASVSAASLDARRFIYNGYGGLTDPFVLGANASFRSFASLTTWLQQLTQFVSNNNTTANSISNTVLVKGHFPITNVVPLDFFAPVYFKGDGGIFDISSSVGFIIGSNVHFDGITFNDGYDASLDGSFSYSNLINSNKACIYSNVGADGYLSNRNISITNCNFVYTVTTLAHPIARFPFISFEFASAGNILQNVNISNNTFSTLVAEDDIRAAIAFTCKLNSGNTSTAAVRLVDCTISGNICDKNQMIAITAPPSPSAPLSEMLATVNCVIEKNECGTISAMVRADTPSNTFNTDLGKPYDKYFSLRIVGNTCQYITATDSTGTEWAAGSPISLTSGAIIVSENTCSWIRMPIAVASSNIKDHKATSIFKSNILNAFDFSWRRSFNGGSSPSDNSAIHVFNPTAIFTTIAAPSNGQFLPQSIINVASTIGFPTSGTIFVTTSAGIQIVTYSGTTSTSFTGCSLISTGGGSMSTGGNVNASYFTDVLITGNHINTGEESTTSPPTSSVTTYSYDTGIFAGQNATITDNIISGVAPALFSPGSPTGIALANNNSIVSGNKLYRGATTWSSYVDGGDNVSGAGTFAISQHTIVNNFFDQPTLDSNPLHTNLITNISLFVVANSNINQTGYAAISLLDYAHYVTPSATAISSNPNGPAYQNAVAFFAPFTGSATFQVERVTPGFFGAQFSNANYTLITSTAADSGNKDFSFTISLDDILPSGVKITDAKLGIWLASIGSLDTTSSQNNNQITLTLNSYYPTASGAPGSNGIADVKNNIVAGSDISNRTSLQYTTITYTAASAGAGYQVVTPATINSATQYCDITAGLPSNSFITGNNFRIAASVDMNYVNTGGSTVTWALSPLVIQYRW
jgi:hypothetical protein